MYKYKHKFRTLLISSINNLSIRLPAVRKVQLGLQTSDLK